MKFTKMQGLGNDYIYFNCMEQEIENPEQLSITLSDRHFGIGGDGIILIMPSKIADFRMRMFNADGSEGKMCGNATRCIGKYVFEKGLTDKTDITLETLSGIKNIHLDLKDGKADKITVEMGKVVLNSEDIPIKWPKKEVIKEPFELLGKTWEITAVSMGNPHCVIFTEGVSEMDLEKIGPSFENHEIFPERVNTEFAEVLKDNTVNMRVWERGSGETMACGTGACATAVAAVKNGFFDYDTDIIVKMLGGELVIRYKEDGTVYMRGDAEFVFDGTYPAE